MAIYGLSITKSGPWEDDPEERFSNIYHYDDDGVGPAGGISDGDAVSLINQVADIERDIHGQSIQFVEGRVWGPVGSDTEEADTLAIVDLTGTGNQTDLSGAITLEHCILCRVRTTRESVRSRPVYLRKWYRFFCATLNGEALTTEQIAIQEPLTQTFRDEVAGIFRRTFVLNTVELTSLPDQLYLSSPSGRRLSQPAPDVEVYEYLQTHDVKY